MNYKTTRMTKEQKSATMLVTIAALAGVLVLGSTVESEHLAYAYKSFSKGIVHMKGNNIKRAIEQPTNINQKTECLTAGGNSPIDASCTNTATTHSTNTGGIGGVRGGTGHDGGIEQPTNIDQKTECETAGGNSGIQGSCINAGGSTTSNTGGSTTSNTGGSTTSNPGGITGSIKLPFGGFP